MQVENKHKPLPNTSNGKGTANSLFSCYMLLKKEQSIKKDGTESITPRYVLSYIEGCFSPIEALKSKDGKVVFYWQRNDKCNPNSTAETRLQCKGAINFSSVYFVGEKIGYGEPPIAKKFKGEKPNPFYRIKEDGYIFMVSTDLKFIEILVVPNGRQMIKGYAQRMQNGDYDNVLEYLRKKPNSL